MLGERLPDVRLPTKTGSNLPKDVEWDTFKMLEIAIIVQLVSLVPQYAITWRFKSTGVTDLYYVLSVTNLLILLARYLSGESEKREKVKAVSALLQFLRLVVIGITSGHDDGAPDFGTSLRT